jgi:hypothetical protein
MNTKYFFALFLIIGMIVSACVKDEVFQGPPVISDLVLTPQAPAENQAVQVSVKVTDLNGVESVKLFYKIESGNYIEVVMTANSNLYTAEIPGLASEITVAYYVMATNKSGLKTYFPDGAPATTAAFTVGAPLIVMNEIYSRGNAADPDWIEIYNASDAEVDISGYSVYDGGGQSGTKPKLAIPEGTLIPAKGFFVMVVDEDSEAGFGLSSGGEEVWMENTKGNIIDNVAFPAFEPNQSYGRNPDGSSTWEILNTITKGGPNNTSDPTAIILMNEIYSTGTTENPDWIELYNASDFEANISGYKLYDSGGQSGSKPKKEVPAGTVIPAKGWFVIVVDDEDESGFGLSSNGEQVWFENPAGTVIDSITFPVLEDGWSYGRFPDGDANLQILYISTPGSANDDSPAPVTGMAMMNEVYSRGTAEEPDWIELFNPSDAEMDISGYKIYDSGGQSGSKPKKEFPAGSVIPAQGWLVIVVDDEDESGFGLSSNGETVWFENAAGVILDSIAFPVLEETQSFGRFPDGDANWQVLPTVTKGAANSDMPPSELMLLHYWHFNDQKEPTLPIESDFSINGLIAAISYPGTGEGYMDYRTVRPQDPASNLNLRMGQEPDQGAVLRVRNPAEGRMLLIEAPSSGFKDLVVMFAITRSSDLAGEQQFYYSADGGNAWMVVGDIFVAQDIPDWNLMTIDLSGVAEVNDNPNLQFKIEYSGDAIGGTSGNNRYDNFTVDGKPVR